MAICGDRLYGSNYGPSVSLAYCPNTDSDTFGLSPIGRGVTHLHRSGVRGDFQPARAGPSNCSTDDTSTDARDNAHTHRKALALTIS